MTYRKQRTDGDTQETGVDGVSTEFDSKLWATKAGWGVIQDDGKGYFEVLDALPLGRRYIRDSVRLEQNNPKIFFGEEGDSDADILPHHFAHQTGDIAEQQKMPLLWTTNQINSAATLSVTLRDAFGTTDYNRHYSIPTGSMRHGGALLQDIVNAFNNATDSEAAPNRYVVAKTEDVGGTSGVLIFEWHKHGPVTSNGEDYVSGTNTYANATVNISTYGLSFKSSLTAFNDTSGNLTVSNNTSVRGESVHIVIDDSEIANQRFYFDTTDPVQALSFTLDPDE